jgi:hypothetical protein
MALLREHVAEFPRDALVLSLALGVFGLLGFSGRADFHEAQLALLETLAPRWDEDWWFLTYDRAKARLAERLARRPSERDRRWLAQVQQVSN